MTMQHSRRLIEAVEQSIRQNEARARSILQAANCRPATYDRLFEKARAALEARERLFQEARAAVDARDHMAAAIGAAITAHKEALPKAQSVPHFDMTRFLGLTANRPNPPRRRPIGF